MLSPWETLLWLTWNGDLWRRTWSQWYQWSSLLIAAHPAQWVHSLVGPVALSHSGSCGKIKLGQWSILKLDIKCLNFSLGFSYYPAESLSWYSEALSKHAWMPESFHRRKMISDSSLGMEPSSMVSARCMSFLASSCRVDSTGQSHVNVIYSHLLANWDHLSLISMRKGSCYLLITVAKVNIECVHGLHNGHDGLQGVAVDDGNELQALFKWVTIFVDNSGEEMQHYNAVYSQFKKKWDTILMQSQMSYFICFTMVLLPDSPAPLWEWEKKRISFEVVCAKKNSKH